MTYPEYEGAKKQHEADIAANPGAWGLPPTKHTHENGETHTHPRGDLPHTHALVTQSDDEALGRWQSAWGQVVNIHTKP